MNTPIDPSQQQQTPLHHFADTLSKWCRKARLRRTEREEDEQEEDFSFGIDESMWDKNSMWHLYDDYKAGEEEEREDWDEKAVLDIAITGRRDSADPEEPHNKSPETRSTTGIKAAAVDNDDPGVFALGKGAEGAEWNDAEVIIDSAGFEEASFYSDEEVSYSGGRLVGQQGTQIDPSVDQILDISQNMKPL